MSFNTILYIKYKPILKQYQKKTPKTERNSDWLPISPDVHVNEETPNIQTFDSPNVICQG